MKRIFKNSDITWACYSEYEIRKDDAGTEYLCPAEGAKVNIVSPLDDPETLIIDTLTVARKIKHPEEEPRRAVLEYFSKYGLFGLMTALPSTPAFTAYEKVYLPKNEFIKEEVMDTGAYIGMFFPFRKPDFSKYHDKVSYSVSGYQEQLALMLAFPDTITEKIMVLHRDYSERYDWICKKFNDFLFVFFTCFLYYREKEHSDEDTLEVYRRAMKMFGANIPSYHIELKDKPTMVWDFCSQGQAIELILSVILTDSDIELCPCMNCCKVYNAKSYKKDFCSKKCENEYINRNKQ